MAAKHKSPKSNEHAGLWAVVAMIVLAAVWAVIPSALLKATWQSEQSQMTYWGGAQANQWVLHDAISQLQSSTLQAVNASSEAIDQAPADMRLWLMDRIYMTMLWVNTSIYRCHAYVLWMLLMIPFVLAASMDGFYVREIRKEEFKSQSPIRHKVGVRILHISLIIITLILVIPVSVPIIFEPVSLMLIGYAIWMWVSNLQKRI